MNELEAVAAAIAAEEQLGRLGYAAINPHSAQPWDLLQARSSSRRAGLMRLAERLQLEVEAEADGTLVAYPPSASSGERRRIRKGATAPSN